MRPGMPPCVVWPVRTPPLCVRENACMHVCARACACGACHGSRSAVTQAEGVPHMRGIDAYTAIATYCHWRQLDSSPFEPQQYQIQGVVNRPSWIGPRVIYP